MKGPRTLCLCLLVGLSGGCFDEIIRNPGATAGSTGTAGTTSGSTSATSAGGSTTAPDESSTTIDDADTTGLTTDTTDTTGTTGAGPLCAGAQHLCGGEAWVVEPCPDCDALTPIAECVLGSLRDVLDGALTIERCDGDCVRDYYVFRSGGAEVLIETHLLDGASEVEVLGRQMCTRVDMMYFSDCIAAYDAACSDPASWVMDCAPFEGDMCPFMVGP
ncbi:MAG: hypothetical protein R3A79_17855 [Nannocystaceae bacterium]